MKKEEPISAFAFKVGRELEKLVEERTGNLSWKFEDLQAKVLNFRQQIKSNPNLLKMYDIWFNIETAKDGNN